MHFKALGKDTEKKISAKRRKLARVVFQVIRKYFRKYCSYSFTNTENNLITVIFKARQIMTCNTLTTTKLANCFGPGAHM